MNPPKPKVKWFIRWEPTSKHFYVVDDQGGVRDADPQWPGKLAEYAFDHGADEVVHQYDHIAVALAQVQADKKPCAKCGSTTGCWDGGDCIIGR